MWKKEVPVWTLATSLSSPLPQILMTFLLVVTVLDVLHEHYKLTAR